MYFLKSPGCESCSLGWLRTPVVWMQSPLLSEDFNKKSLSSMPCLRSPGFENPVWWSGQKEGSNGRVGPIREEPMAIFKFINKK